MGCCCTKSQHTKIPTQDAEEDDEQVPNSAHQSHVHPNNSNHGRHPRVSQHPPRPRDSNDDRQQATDTQRLLDSSPRINSPRTSHTNDNNNNNNDNENGTYHSMSVEPQPLLPHGSQINISGIVAGNVSITMQNNEMNDHLENHHNINYVNNVKNQKNHNHRMIGIVANNDDNNRNKNETQDRNTSPHGKAGIMTPKSHKSNISSVNNDNHGSTTSNEKRKARSDTSDVNMDRSCICYNDHE